MAERNIYMNKNNKINNNSKTLYFKNKIVFKVSLTQNIYNNIDHDNYFFKLKKKKKS